MSYYIMNDVTSMCEYLNCHW